jgi:hypothetical protein
LGCGATYGNDFGIGGKMSDLTPTTQRIMPSDFRLDHSAGNMFVHVQKAQEALLRALREPASWRSTVLDAYASLDHAQQAFGWGWRDE